jgi:hypothetical protein
MRTDTGDGEREVDGGVPDAPARFEGHPFACRAPEAGRATRKGSPDASDDEELVGAVAASVLLGAVTTAAARADELPAGLASDFPLSMVAAGGKLVTRTFTDASGNVVPTPAAGRGPTLTFTNVTTRATYQTPSNGTVTQVRYNADGSQTFVTTGHNVLILYPTDTPPGPSTTLLMGRVVFTVSPVGVFQVRSVSGRSVDICAALGG